MNLLERLREYSESKAEECAVATENEVPASLTYGQLCLYSDRLASWIMHNVPGDHSPIPVFGHKNPFMLVCFLACVKAGHSYCPIDVSNPATRTEAILREVNPHLVLETVPLDVSEKRGLSLGEITGICETACEITVGNETYVSEDDVFYIIFTSGSTGTPKGVQITAGCLDHFLAWSETLTGFEAGTEKSVRFLNQAPFSFDLSVMDLYTSLYTGGCLWCLPKPVQTNMAALFASLKASGAEVWVSTPSFADVCLSDPSFDERLMPSVTTFFFCGETLTNATAHNLQQRFPRAVILNTYGPTESTVAVTGVTVTPQLNESVSPLPVGKAKRGTWIYIMNQQQEKLPDGEKGEIVIVGDTVSGGYFNRPDLTARAFCRLAADGTEYRAYHTGDEGYLKDGMLYYSGRIDSQVKLHGYRIEIEDIENNIMKLPEIKKAVVIPVYRDSKVHSLTAVAITEGGVPESTFAASQRYRQLLKEFLPEYMIPKKFVFTDSFPMTNNGKVDRNALGGLK